ncbi:MAG: FAD-dependent monooxygenase [Planctomycetota bacterium]
MTPSQRATAEFRILVVGGGPGGAAAAIRLRQLGFNVLLVDRDAFPRDKVCGCCIGPRGVGLLRDLFRGRPMETFNDFQKLTDWHGHFDGHHCRHPLRNGIAVSRQVLDLAMQDHAEALGVTIRRRTQADFVSADDRTVTVRLQARVDVADKSTPDDVDTIIDFDAVILAGGLKAHGFQRALPWVQVPSGPCGVGCKTEAFADLRPGHLHMIAGQNGYVGLVALPDGSTDVAAAIWPTKQKSPKDSTIELLEQAGFADGQAGAWNWKTTPQLRRVRFGGTGRLLAVGDAAGYFEPFTGEGMTWAMQSGIEASEFLAESFGDSAINPVTVDLGQVWATRLARRNRRRQRLCRLLSAGLRRRSVRRAAVTCIRRLPAWMPSPFW